MDATYPLSSQHLFKAFPRLLAAQMTRVVVDPMWPHHSRNPDASVLFLLDQMGTLDLGFLKTKSCTLHLFSVVAGIKSSTASTGCQAAANVPWRVNAVFTFQECDGKTLVFRAISDVIVTEAGVAGVFVALDYFRS